VDVALVLDAGLRLAVPDFVTPRGGSEDVTLRDCATLGEPDCEPVPDAATVLAADTERVCVRVAGGVLLGVRVDVVVTVPVPLAVEDGVDDCVEDGVPDNDCDGVAVTDDEGVTVRDALAVPLWDALQVAETLALGVPVAV
jgi:hypothetical protein